MVASTATTSKSLSILGQSAPVAAWKKALGRARSEGVRVFHVEGKWYASSISQPNRRHHVNGHCDCQAGERGIVCKHLAAVRSAQLKTGELVQCPHCKTVGSKGTEIVERLGYVGGRGYQSYLQCADERACWSRWDKANGFAS